MFRRRFELLKIVGSPVYRGVNQKFDVVFDINTMTINNSDLDAEIKRHIDKLCQLYIRSMQFRAFEER
jgi:hypothetical protein